MFCSRCGNELASNAAFCGACGTRASVSVGTVPALTRPPIVTVLAVLQFIGATILFLAGLVLLVSPPSTDSGAAQAVVALVLAGLGALQLMCGIGLWNLKPYGRTIQLVFAWIGLLGIPVGSIISILILMYLFKPGARALFSGKEVAELTAEEWAQIAAVSRGGFATILIVVAVIFGSIIAVGIIAAIAIPGLLRARMSGNEASAIGSLRAINSAQTAFASSCGKGFYAATLAGLATPPPGQPEGFLSNDLGRDPSVKSGYTISLVGNDARPDAEVACNGSTVVRGYFVSAEPLTAGSTGTRFFATNQDGAVFQSMSAIPVTHVGPPTGAIPIR